MMENNNIASPVQSKGNNRLLSLDVLRGLTVVGMILVNNGAGHVHFAPLEHCAWNGMTPCDLVFPFFLFMVGVSIAFSLGKYTETNLQAEAQTSKAPVIRKILIRTLKMFLIGVLLHAWDMWVWDEENILANLRIWGVLERIALCYCATSLIVIFVRKRYYWHIIVALLALYSIILLIGNGYAQDESNIASIIDRALFGEAHLYHKSPIDPEGLLGTMPSIAHTLIGVVIGMIIKGKEALSERLVRLFTVACSIAIIGYLLSYGFPLNKRIWSPSYVLVTCGLATALLGIFTVVTDIKKREKWSRPFRWFGMNAIILYVVSEMLPSLMWKCKIPSSIYNSLVSVMGYSEAESAPETVLQVASLGYALSFVLLMTLLAWAMYRKKFFVKI